MSEMLLRERVALADKLRALKGAAAEAVTDAFLARHPDWVERYGERARRFGIEDAAFHIDFLAGAVETGAAAPFEDYARWTVRTLSARGIASSFVKENLEQVAAFYASRVSSDEQQLAGAIVAAACRACDEPVATEAPGALASGLQLSRNLFLQAILKGQRQAALTVAEEALRAGHAVRDVYVELFQASLYEVGRLWETNRITVAEEHMATAITQYVVARMYPQLGTSERGRGRMIITGVEGELHQIGPNMVADVLEADGWDVRFLGTNMPHAGILQAIEEHEAQVLGISTTMLFNLPKVSALVAAVRAKLQARAPRIVLGGSAFRLAPELYRELGAQGFAPDLREAVTLARSWS
jgi:MerR family transcriptional regulator, light-induced transcriptional regulator